jgi:hypothetical protein
MVPGTVLVPGSQCNNCVVTVNIPFSYALYDHTFTSAIAGTNGVLGFMSNTNASHSSCLPSTSLSHAIAAYWDDLDTRANRFCGPNCGIYTSTTGTAPNRVFNIEWRAKRRGTNADVNFEVRLYEGLRRFDIIYNSVANGGSTAVVGVQHEASGQFRNFTQFSCNTASLTPGLQLTFQQSCSSGGASQQLGASGVIPAALTNSGVASGDPQSRFPSELTTVTAQLVKVLDFTGGLISVLPGVDSSQIK